MRNEKLLSNKASMREIVESVRRNVIDWSVTIEIFYDDIFIVFISLSRLNFNSYIQKKKS